MNVDRFAQQLEGAHLRLVELYQDATDIGQPLQYDLHQVSSEALSLLPTTFKELGTASEELQVAVEELRQQNEELAAARAAVEAERQRYQDFFELAPDGYLVTDLNGMIRFANRTATAILNVSQQFLTGKPMTAFVTQAGRQSFRSGLNQLQQIMDHPDGTSTTEVSILRRRREWEVCLQPRHGKPFTAALTITAVREPGAKSLTLHWLLRDITERRQTERLLEKSNVDRHDFSLHTYAKRENIPINPQVIWQVKQGLVKLSTFCDTGEEVLVGLIGPSMVFGPSLTSLQTFQAIALSAEVQLACLPLSEIAASPHLAQSLLPQMNQRLQQTEALLATSGERRVSDRLHCLLRLLKQEIGQPVAQGTRLSIRLTHEDLASACCTTRVTITRLLSRFQQQGKLALCPKRHIILKEERFEHLGKS